MAPPLINGISLIRVSIFTNQYWVEIAKERAFKSGESIQFELGAIWLDAVQAFANAGIDQQFLPVYAGMLCNQYWIEQAIIEQTNSSDSLLTILANMSDNT